MACERSELLDAHRLRQCQLVCVMQPHRPQRDSGHGRRGFEQLQVIRQEPAALESQGGDAADHAIVLDDRHPDHVARVGTEEVGAERARQLDLVLEPCIHDRRAGLDHPLEERRPCHRHRAD